MSRPAKISPSIIGHKIDLGTYTLTHKDFILYALGIGFSRGISLLKQILLTRVTLNTLMNLTKNFQVIRL